jgi:hypothetical protein
LGATALVVKLTSPGPVFERGERVGWHGRRFVQLTYRTSLSYSHRPPSRKQWKRAMLVSRFLRRNSLHVLPQLVNVVKGEMSMIGPRAPAPSRPPCIPSRRLGAPSEESPWHLRAGATGARGHLTVRSRRSLDRRGRCGPGLGARRLLRTALAELKSAWRPVMPGGRGGVLSVPGVGNPPTPGASASLPGTASGPRGHQG